MNREPVERALAAARNAHAIQRQAEWFKNMKYEANAGPPPGDYPTDRAINAMPIPQYPIEQRQAVIILHRSAPKSDAQQADHEQTIADLIQQVRHTRGRM